MALVESPGYSHVRLTVTDIARSRAFYDLVFGWPVLVDNSARVGEPGVTESAAEFYGGIIYRMPSGMLLGLRPVAPAGQRFDSEHTGLDHVSFQVASRDALAAAATAMTGAGIAHGEVTDLPGGLSILSFEDPDGVHCELTAPR